MTLMAAGLPVTAPDDRIIDQRTLPARASPTEIRISHHARGNGGRCSRTPAAIAVITRIALLSINMARPPTVDTRNANGMRATAAATPAQRTIADHLADGRDNANPTVPRFHDEPFETP